MGKLKGVFSSKWFFPAIVSYYGIFYILFGEWYPKVVSTDGRVFLTLVSSITESDYFNTYYVYRILPPLIIKLFHQLFSIAPIAEKVFVTFQILNLACIITTCFFLKELFTLLRVSTKKQIFGIALFLLNFAILKYPFYLPIMTDTFAIMLSTMLLYFYLKNNTVGIITTTLALAFTWPMAYYQGLLLIALPINILPYSPPSKQQKRVLYAGSTLFTLILITLFIFIQKKDTEVYYVAPIDRNVLPLSIIGVATTYFFFARLFFNKALLDATLFIQKIDLKRILFSIVVFVIVAITVYLLHPQPTPTYSTAQMLRDPTMHALIKPFLFIVADTTYFGIVICLLIFFWSSFSKVISQMGWGIVAAFVLNLFLFGVTPQSRHLSNLFPWIIVFLIKAIDKYSFSNFFYIVVGLLGFFVSKIWLILNNFEAYPPMQLDRNGSMGFPQQKFWMHIGPWMNEQMYFVQGGILFLLMSVLFFMIYKVETNKLNGRWGFVNRYK